MKTLKRLLKPLSDTVLHPQYLVFRDRKRLIALLSENAHGRVLDIGCGDRWVASTLGDAAEYIGLDYPGTVSLGYDGAADVLGNGMQLPFSDASFDTVVLLDVLEHLPTAARAIAEAHRVLRPSGVLIVQVPFLYPLHDEPFDFTRWTCHGLCDLFRQQGFQTDTMAYHGNPVETASALFSIALTRAVLDTFKRGHPSILLAPFLLALIPLVNSVGAVLGLVLPRSALMPLSYRLIGRKS